MRLDYQQAGQTVSCALNKELMFIGSGADADVVLQGAAIPEACCQLERQGGGYVISSLNNSGDCTLNGKSFVSAALKPGDTLSVGGESILVRAEDPAAAPQPESSPMEGALLELAESVGTEKDLGKTLQLILEQAMKFFKASEGVLYTLKADSSVEKTAARGQSDTELVFSDTLVQKVLESKKGVVIPSMLDTPEFSSARSIADLNLHTLLCSPILLSGELAGLIYLGAREVSRSYTRESLRQCQVFSAIAGTLIHNVAYIAQQQKALQNLSRTAQRGGMIAGSPAMKKVLDLIEPIAPTDITVLIHGETGTGKDVLANYIHEISPQKGGPFIPVNCSSLRDELLESELFGYKKGAFTGAVADRKGLFQAAHGGTLFLDEVGEMNMGLQAKLLRVLETGKIRPVGDVSEISVQVRIITATNKNLKEMVSQEKFREDLYFRLAQFTVDLPPLRERGEDILALAYFFLEQFKGKYPHKQMVDFSDSAKKSLVEHEWPGNIREMFHTLHRSFLISPGPLLDLNDPDYKQTLAGLEEATKRFQKNYIERALVLAGGNKEEAAKMLGMSRSTFFRYLSQMDIT